MTFQPYQVRDLIVSIDRKIKSLKEKYAQALEEIKEQVAKLRKDKTNDSKELDKKEEKIIKEQKELYTKKIAKLNDKLIKLKVQREQMLKDLELPAEIK